MKSKDLSMESNVCEEKLDCLKIVIALDSFGGWNRREGNGMVGSVAGLLLPKANLVAPRLVFGF